MTTRKYAPDLETGPRAEDPDVGSQDCKEAVPRELNKVIFLKIDPPTSPTNLVGDNTEVLGHAFEHQASQTRSLEAARAAGSTNLVSQYHIIGNHSKPMKSLKIYENS